MIHFRMNSKSIRPPSFPQFTLTGRAEATGQIMRQALTRLDCLIHSQLITFINHLIEHDIRLRGYNMVLE